jgi:hypothetical protein
MALVDGRCPYCTGSQFEVIRAVSLREQGEPIWEPDLKSVCMSCGATYPVENVDGATLRDKLGGPE